jgi:hypothetical protein
MRFRDKFLTAIILSLLIGYITGYVAYRNFGPCWISWPRGVDAQFPWLLSRTESRSDILLYRLFSPCISVEQFYLKLKYATPPQAASLHLHDNYRSLAGVC